MRPASDGIVSSGYSSHDLLVAVHQTVCLMTNGPNRPACHTLHLFKRSNLRASLRESFGFLLALQIARRLCTALLPLFLELLTTLWLFKLCFAVLTVKGALHENQEKRVQSLFVVAGVPASNVHAGKGKQCMQIDAAGFHSPVQALSTS